VGGLADGPDPDPQAGAGAGAAGVAAALVGGAGLVQAGVVPGRYRAGRLLGACDLGGLPPTTVAPGPLRFASFPSQRRRRQVGYGVAWPPGSGPGDRLGVCLLLHAAAGDQRAPFERLRMHHHLAQAAGAGRIRPFALASADGRGSDWRPAPGDDPFGMLLDELLPLLSGLVCTPAPARWPSSAGRWAPPAPAAGRGRRDQGLPRRRLLAAPGPAQLRFVAGALGS